ncbi:MAG: DUF1365 domain-containing protein [Gemmatimonadetes bacterium]|nr:DUF1365 domain-containing protein [Gemmatimonadota bacterium]
MRGSGAVGVQTVTKSAIYEGKVRHRRFEPRPHDFTYTLFMMYLDLDELPALFRGRLFWSAKGPSLAWFRRRDHMPPFDRPLDETVRALVEERTGTRPDGPIRLLTHLRYFGYCMNPVSFYYCFDEADEEVRFVVAEVHNTPWGEQHCYVFSRRQESGAGAPIRSEFKKEFHVSPFMSMDVDYDWRFGAPADTLTVQMNNHSSGGERFFDATMKLDRRRIDGRSLASVLARYPFMTGKVIAGIYLQALKLWLKGVPYHSHPKDRKEKEVT